MNNGTMQESGDRVAALENVTLDTFAGFCEYAYTGDYRNPLVLADDGDAFGADSVGARGSDVKEGELKPLSEETLEETLEEDGGIAGFASKKKKKRQESKCEAVQYYDEYQYNGFGRPPRSVPPSTTERLRQSFNEIKYDAHKPEESRPLNLLFHARLYTLAEEKLIEPLQTCCLGHLHRELLHFEVKQDNCQEFLQLLRFAYSCRSRQSFCGEDRLRKLVIHYAACNLEKLVVQGEFMALLDCYGEMGSDLIRRLIT